MATCFLSALFGAGAQLLDNQGRILSNGTISTFQAGTSTPLATFTDSTGGTSNGTVITLDAFGRPPQEIWLTGGSSYKFIVKDSTGVQIGLAYDNITGIGDLSAATTAAEWVAFSGTPSYISTTSFSVTGDQTSKFPVGQRIKFVCTGGTGYATILSSAFSAGVTTITTVNDSLNLDSGLSAVSYGLLNAASPSEDAAGVSYKPTVPPPAGSTAAELARARQALNVLTTGGTSTAYTLTPTAALTAYSGSPPFLVKFHTPNGATPTINVSGLGAKNLRAYNEQTSAAVDPTLVSGHEYWIVYDLALDAYLVLNTTINGFGGAVTLSALADFTKSLVAAGGYQKLPGGLVIQWGQIAIGDIPGGVNTSTTITFPLAFPTACFGLVATIADANAGAGNPFVFVYGGTVPTTTQAVLWYGESGAFAENARIFWIALGN